MFRCIGATQYHISTVSIKSKNRKFFSVDPFRKEQEDSRGGGGGKISSPNFLFRYHRNINKMSSPTTMPRNLLDDSIDSTNYTNSHDISHILSTSSSEQNQPTMHFLEKSDLLIKLSRIIFEDFHNHILPINNRTKDVNISDETENDFFDIIHKFLEISEHGVKGVEKICTEPGQIDPHSKMMLEQLTLERAAYNLILRSHNSNRLLSDNENLISTSFLTKLFRENEQFRVISTLLLWNEECSTSSPTQFSRISDEDAFKLSELDNIYACTKIRGPIHVDSRFLDRIAAEDEEAVQTLNRVLFSLLRSGRLEDAKSLVENVGLPALSTFIIIRQFLVDPNLSPLDPLDDQFNLAQSRMHFKQAARDLIPQDDERIQSSDHCIWATLGGHLPTLLSYAYCTEDRLWAYLSCAAEVLFDDALSAVHAKLDEQVNLLAKDMSTENADIPRDVHSIFTELHNNEESPYYALFEHLALQQWTPAAKFIDLYVQKRDHVPAHQLRLFIHLLLLLKLTGQPPDMKIIDRLIMQYVSLLSDMKLDSLVPFYLYHLSEEQSTSKMLDFLEGIAYEPDKKELLQSTHNVGFNVTELCREVFKRFKRKYKIDGTQSLEQNTKSAEELIRAWKWLIYCGPETIWDAIVEANYLLRKLFLHNQMCEAIELMRMTPDNLGFDAFDTFNKEFPHLEVPLELLDARHEFECYQFYFEAITRYGEWQKQVEGGQAPEMPAKLSDEKWARMDIRRRTEYELNVKKARDCLQKYYKLVELCKKRSIEMIESILKMPDGWLVILPSTSSDEDATDPEVVERANDFVEIRKHCLAHLLELLVGIHTRSDEPMRVLEVASLLVDPRYNLYKALAKDKLQKLLTEISSSGAALL